MSAELLLYAVLLPLLFWVVYHYYHDRHRPEPVINLMITLGLGVGSSLLATLGYLGLDVLGWRFDALSLAETDLVGLALYAVLGIGLIEELAKLVPFLFIVLHFSDFDEPLDGIVYASFLALGFAMAENYHYADHLSATEAIARGFAAPVVHIVFASLWGHHVGLAALAGRPVMPVALRWLAVAALLHGGYDVIVLAFSDSALLVASALVLIIWAWRLRIVWRAAAG
ncbi:MAG: PrsW family intramembrane metalloprotease [Pseudomonadales bacterium]